jgi:acetylornithine aminotransferase/acetylornithine/N-succinyldiaminopimelate aminotransferase
MNTFGDRTPVCFDHGEGMILTDTNGKKYYDFFAGVAVDALGHSHPAIVNAIKTQTDKFIHCSNHYYIEAQAKLAELLVENSCADKVFISNSGAEANEAALKLAKIYYYKKGKPEKREFVTVYNSFHGRTLATVAATGQEKYQMPYRPIVTGFKHVPLNDIEALRAAVHKETTCAVMLEIVQGEGGVYLASKEFIAEASKLCKELDILLIFDEIQTGIGRTGKLFAYEHYGIEPDIFTLAKALGSGFPIGAVLAKGEVAGAFTVGDHGSTYAGNPLACEVAYISVSTIINEGLVAAADEKGKYFAEKLATLKEKHSSRIKEIRGLGLMIGVHLTTPDAAAVKNKLFEAGFLVGSAGADILRLLPPLIVSHHEIDKIIEALDNALSERR